MKKDKTADTNETVQKEETQAMQPFFFPREGRTILATSLMEAQKQLEAEKAGVETSQG